jgi:hypothetical protein
MPTHGIIRNIAHECLKSLGIITKLAIKTDFIKSTGVIKTK